MLHAEEIGEHIQRTSSVRLCHFEAPTTAAAQVTDVATHGDKESGDYDLGIQFIERMTIRCV
jgi:hypothetical protein